MTIKVIIISHNQPESVDALYLQLKSGFDDIEVWDTNSDFDKVPMSITISDENVYWEGVWAKAMQRYAHYDVLWVLGGDIVLKGEAGSYRKAIEDSMPFGCWSPCIDGRAHPFMLCNHYGSRDAVSVRNIEGMALAVSGELIRAIGGKFEVSTEIGFGQDYWLCYSSRKNGMRNIIDGRVVVFHPPGIGYNEESAHDAMENVFSARYGSDFRRTIFEYDQTYDGNLIKEKQMITIISVENGWGVPELESIMRLVKGDVRWMVMQKGVSNFDVKNAKVLPYTTDLEGLISQADIALFPRVGPANEKEYRRILSSGVPTVVNDHYHQGQIDHEKNGFRYGHPSWGAQWVNALIADESLRSRIKLARVPLAPSVNPPVATLLGVSDDVMKARMDHASGVGKKMVDLLNDPVNDPEEKQNDVLVTVITPTYRRDPGIIRRSYDCLKLQTVESWEQLICSDGGDEPHVRELVIDIDDNRVSYHHLKEKKEGDYGNICRSEMLKLAKGKYILFLDDDNIILPAYLERMMYEIERSGKDFAVCRIMHFGPLNEGVIGKPPKVLEGEPVKLYSVDPLQILVKREVMQSVGWNTSRGYIADGVSLEELGKKYKYVKVPEVLGIHV